MKVALFAVTCLAVLAVVFSNQCMHHDDPSNCNLNCGDANMEPGCEGPEHTCTCVMSPISCVGDLAACTGMQCEHKQEGHCLDGMCKCLEMH